MQLKGLVIVSTVALIAISLYQLSFTQLVKNFENKQSSKIDSQIKAANPGASESSLKTLINDRTILVLDSLSSQKIGMGMTYQKAKSQELSLGLDLQGGMNFTLEVGLEELVRNLSNSPADPALNKAIATASLERKNNKENFINLFAKAYLAQNAGARLAPLFVKSGQQNITFNTSNDDVISKLRAESKGAVKNTYEVINKRIDKFGVAQPNISLDENKDIITVELAGAQNPERARQFLVGNAKLEFWETYSNYELGNDISNADKALKAYLGGEVKDSTGKVIVKGNVNANDTATTLTGLIGNKGTGATTGAGATDSSAEGKMNKFKKENPFIAAIGYMPPQMNEKTGKYYESAMVGALESKDTAKLNSYLALDIVKNALPKNLKFLYGIPNKEVREKSPKALFVYAIKTVTGTDKPRLSGEHVTKTRADFVPITGDPAVFMEMDQTGAEAWRLMTRNNEGKSLALALDDIVYSAPVSNGEIPNGSTQISGSFSTEETNDLANILKSGKLDAPAKIVQEQIVGPTMGAENIKAGKRSFLIAFLVIFALMLVYYNTSGMVANIALIFNLLFTIGVLSALGATLTMAGIAGLVLTVGMAVDTNVIIFERIKEELASGKSTKDAVNEGYRRSLAPVLDGHFTVFLTALILFIFGLGPVRGFATTQMLGIILSLFCGILLSRLVTEIFMSRGKSLEYFTSLGKSVFRKFHFKFIEARKYAYMISIVVLLLGVGSFFNGFEKGVEFKGGRNYTINLDNKTDLDAIKNGLKPSLLSYPIVKTAGSGNNVMITTDFMKEDAGKDIENTVGQKLYEGLKSINAVNAASFEDFKVKNQVSVNSVSPSISADLQNGAIKATIISIILIILYIFIRFRKWQYSLGTVVALLHDVFVMLAVFSFLRKVVPFSLEIDQHFIAAVLTVIGFSMNDTVIVFDRIREYFAKRPGASKTSVINDAINDTLSRTIMTSLTVFLTLLILFIFGGDATKGFAFAMLIGVVTGTYSSIFVAAPILVDLDKSENLGKEVDRDLKIEELKKLA
jgi:SecD/SecF fusion protein